MKARPKSGVKNALTGEDVSPDLDWLINRLAALDPPTAKDHPRVVDFHAHEIRGHYLMWCDGDKPAIKIRGRERPYAKRVAADRGTANELKRLLIAAKGKSDRRWQTAWLGISGTTHSLIGWPPIKRGSAGRRVSVRGLEAIMPTRADAVPLIEAALAKLEAMPAADRRKRQGDALAADVVHAVRMAQRVMVHDSKILHGNGLARLGRDINERFRCDFIF